MTRYSGVEPAIAHQRDENVDLRNADRARLVNDEKFGRHAY